MLCCPIYFRRLVIVFCFTTVCCPSFSQDKLADSKELIENGIKLYDEQRYQEALKVLLQVPEGDTNYASAKYETALTYLADSAYEEAKITALEGLELQDASPRDFLLIIGHAYDYLGQRDSAIAIYKELAKINPTDHQPIFEEGVVYFQQQKYEEAISLFQRSLMINPYHYRSHLMLGTCYYLQGRLTEAFIALEVSLLTSNNINVARSSIALLGDLTKQADEARKAYESKQEHHRHVVYDDVDQIINAKLALNKGYKIESVLNDAEIIRVAHVIMEKLKYVPKDDNFVMQYYVPMLKEVYDKKLFDPYMLLLFSGYNIEAVEKFAKKQHKDVTEVRGILFPYMSKILATRILSYAERERAKEQYFLDQASDVYFNGNFVTEKGKTAVAAGYARLYQNGRLAAEGSYNNTGKKTGPWKYFHPNGFVKLTENYNDGKIVGELMRYRRSGQPAYYERYNNKEEMVEEKRYTYNGLLSEVTIIKDNKDKTTTTYHRNGQTNLKLVFKDEKIVDGSYTDFHENGQKRRVMEITGGKLDGRYKDHYDNGQVKEDGTFKDGNRVGEFKNYYENGKLYTLLNYDDGELDGPYEEYNDLGDLVSKGYYKKGKRHGPDLDFEDGRQYGRIEYKEGSPVAYEFTNGEGKVVGEQKEGKLSMLRVFYANGAKRSEIPMRNGMFEGEAKYFYSTGALKEQLTYRNGLADGISTEYYRNGKISSKTTMVKGEKTGAYSSYYVNGQLKTKGWLLKGNKEGQWITYSPNGKPDDEIFYIDNEVNGPYKQYNVNGELDYIDFYDRDMIIGVKQYDSTGKILISKRFPGGNGAYKLVYPNGEKYFECELKNGLYQGKFAKYYPGNKIVETGFYNYGSRDSIYTSYFHNGRTSAKGKYSKGKKEGLWQYFTSEGLLARETEYEDDEEEGKDRVYVNGQLHTEFNMHNDNMEGNQVYYGEKNKVACVLKYSNKDLVGYSYMDKDGNLVPMVPIKNGTAQFSTFYPNGAKSTEFNFVEGRLAGKQVRYYSNGQISEERTIENSDYNGPYRRYYEEGKLMYEAFYKDSLLVGEERHYDKDGAVRTNNYFYDKLHGMQQFKDLLTGNTTSIYYHYGRPVFVKN